MGSVREVSSILRTGSEFAYHLLGFIGCSAFAAEGCVFVAMDFDHSSAHVEQVALYGRHAK
jgi:hypothetical protein